jgi:hypothetical protein
VTRPAEACETEQSLKKAVSMMTAITPKDAPGHTIDHYSGLIGQPGQGALITGDMISTRQ